MAKDDVLLSSRGVHDPAVIRALVDELARVFSSAASARLLATRSGFPREHLPRFVTALGFWTAVIDDVIGGRLTGGVRAVVEEAARQFPANTVFAGWSGEVRPTEGQGVASATRGARTQAAKQLPHNEIFAGWREGPPSGPGRRAGSARRSPGSAEPTTRAGTPRAPRKTEGTPAKKRARSTERAPSDLDTVDVLLITALHEEYRAVLEVSDDAIDPEWLEQRDGPFGRTVARRRFRGVGDRVVTVLATWADEMASTATAAIAGMLQSKLRPRCLAMTGIAAGPRGKVELGDVVFGHRLFTHDTGKVKARGKGPKRTVIFKGDPNPYQLHVRWKPRVEMFVEARNRELARKPPPWVKKRPLTLERQGLWVLAQLLARRDPLVHPGRNRYCPEWAATLERLRAQGLVAKRAIAFTKRGEQRARSQAELYPDGRGPTSPVRLWLGDIASGNAVIDDAEIFARIESWMRKTIGVEMEAAAIGAVARLGEVPWIVAKAICDFGDSDKDDRFHAFAARASAESLLGFLRANADLLVAPPTSPTGDTGDTGGGSHGRGTPMTKPAGARSKKKGAGLVAGPWKAIPELTQILEGAPLAFLESLGRALGKPVGSAPSKAKHVAGTIDALGKGPAVGARLVKACHEAWARVPTDREARRSAAEVALRLSLTWLPRRYGDGSQAWLVHGRVDPKTDGYCPDLEVGTVDPVMTDVHSSASEGVASSLKRAKGDQSGKESLDFVGTRRLANLEAVLAEMKPAKQLGEALAEGLAAQFATSSMATKDRGIVEKMAKHLKLRREGGDPRYLVIDADKLPEATLVAIKEKLPAARLVTSRGSTDAFETEIVPILWNFLIQTLE